MTYQLRWLFNAKAILVEERRGHYSTHSCEDKRVHAFPKDTGCQGKIWNNFLNFFVWLVQFKKKNSVILNFHD